MSNAVWIKCIGKQYERLTVVDRDYSRADRVYLNCRCSCGALKSVKFASLQSGAIRSCGCLAKETVSSRSVTHGGAARGQREAEYESWVGMNKRCNNPKDKLYSYYGGRGIAVCLEWQGMYGYENFLAHVGNKPGAEYSIERIDNMRGYEPGNVRWATKKEQARNRRSSVFFEINGVKKTLAEWCELYGADYKRTHLRVRRYGWSVEKALGL